MPVKLLRDLGYDELLDEARPYLRGFNPGQERDERGRFAPGGGSDDVPTGGGRRGKTGQAALDAVPTEYRSGPRAHFGDYEGATFTGPTGGGDPQALAEYEGVEYQGTNSHLRSGPLAEKLPADYVTDPENAARIAEQDAVTAARIGEIDKIMEVSRLQSDVEVSRVIKDGKSVFGDAWHEGVIDFHSGDFDAIDAQYERWLAGDRPDLTGVSWTERGYVSTSANPDHSEAFGERWARMAREMPDSQGEPVIMTIQVPEGTGAVQLGQMGFTEGPGGRQIMGSAEILLEHGLTMTVTADHGVDENGFRQLDVEASHG